MEIKQINTSKIAIYKILKNKKKKKRKERTNCSYTLHNYSNIFDY